MLDLTILFVIYLQYSISTHNILNQISHRENSSMLPLQSKAYQWELLIIPPSLTIQTLKNKIKKKLYKFFPSIFQLQLQSDN